MSDLGKILIERIARSGPLTMADFMAAAAAEPGVGYYRHREAVGREGDFITAPEVSQIFGELLGLWCVEAWSRAGCPASFNLVELGPGRGTLMADALRAAARVAAPFVAAARLHLVEIHPAFRAHQQAALAGTFPGLSIAWHDSLATVPDGPVLLLANEFFDALPVRQFVAGETGWQERCVGLAGDGFAMTLSAGAPSAAGLDGAVPGTIVEECPLATSLAGEIAARIVRHGGAALIIDYGGRGPVTGDTVQAVWRHRPVGIFDRPGEADLSHQVDFAALAEAAGAVGTCCHGPIPQGLFLGRLGIEARADQLKAGAEPAVQAGIDAAVRRLVHPASMGSLFKAFAVASSALGVPPGFAATARRASNARTITRSRTDG